MNGQTGNGLFLSRHFQNAYVTRNIDAAAKMFADRHGIRAFHYMRDIPFGPGATIHIGLAWAGDVMVELIQADGTAANLYTTMLPPEGQLVRFHHLGHLIDQRAEWDGVVERVERSGLPIAIRGNNYGLNYLYVDTTAETGHYLEYIHLDPEARHFFDQVPRN
jgi:hypothetical protein